MALAQLLTCLCRVRDMGTSTSLKCATEERGFTHPTSSMETRDFTWGRRDSPDTEDNGRTSLCISCCFFLVPLKKRFHQCSAGAAWGCSELHWERRELTWDPDLPPWIALVCSGFPNSWVPNEPQLLGRAWNQPQEQPWSSAGPKDDSTAVRLLPRWTWLHPELHP